MLERIRVREADIENNLDAIVQQLLLKEEVTNQRHRLLIDHFVVEKINEITHTADQLADLYLDEDDIVTLRNAPSEGHEVLALAMKEFDAKVADIREHRSSSTRSLPPIRHTLPHPTPKLLDHVFRLPELFGRCFYLEDSYQLFFQFMEQTMDLASRAKEEEEEAEEGDEEENGVEETGAISYHIGTDGEKNIAFHWLRKAVVSWLSSWEPCLEYLPFIARLTALIQRSIPAHRKLMGFQLYRRWVTDLLQYLNDFYDRVAPLASPQRDQLMHDVEAKLAEYWIALENERAIPWAEEGGSLLETDAAVFSPTSTSSESLHLHAKKCSGLLVPTTLRKHLDHFSLWPLRFVSSVIQQAQSSVISPSDRSSTEAHDPRYREGNREPLDGSGGSAMNTSCHPWPEEEALLKYFPRSEEEVREVCLVEGKVVALLRSLLFEPFQYTEKYLRRTQGKTLEEQENERIESEEAFLDSFHRLQNHFSLHTVESTIAQAAQYHLEAQKDQALEDRRKEKNAGIGNSSASPHTQKDNLKEEDEGEEGDEKGEELIEEDGKPIPRWLIHLQQLNKIFMCDVCGGTVYRGPKMFREHFGGERHAEGLRRIGITEHLKTFEGLHTIQDVITLRDQLEQLRVKTRKRLRREHELEEMQDASGKVVTAGAYAQYQYRKA